MSLGEDLLKKLNKKYEPSAMVSFRFRSKDVSVQTDEEGNPVKLFIGKRSEDGMVKGERYARVIRKDKNGLIVKDHWDRKGKSS